MDLKSLSIPSSISESAEYVVSKARHVSIDEGPFSDVAEKVRTRLAAPRQTLEEAFGSAGTLDADLNLISFETAANFCFWAESDETKWTVEGDGKQIGGWYGLAASFERAIQSGLAVTDAAWMCELTIAQGRELFGGTRSDIPLLEQRVQNIVEAARYLREQHGGEVTNLLKSVGYSAPKLAEEVVHSLPSFRDGALYGDRWVWILKRAQIFPSDLSQLESKYSKLVIKDLDQLTAFADYRIPQVLRHFGILHYAPELSERVNAGKLIPAGSVEEVEIRMATIVAIERMKQASGSNSAEMDLGLWLLSQDIKSDLLLHHRTVSQYY